MKQNIVSAWKSFPVFKEQPSNISIALLGEETKYNLGPGRSTIGK
jgi:hypothetical protein